MFLTILFAFIKDFKLFEEATGQNKNPGARKPRLSRVFCASKRMGALSYIRMKKYQYSQHKKAEAQEIKPNTITIRFSDQPYFRLKW